MKADLLIQNANIWVGKNHRAHCMALKDGKVLALDQQLEATKTINLGGASIFPGWNDAHVHVWKVGHLRTTMLDLRETTTLEEVYGLVQARVATLEAGQWLLGRGWNEAKLGASPNKGVLDKIAPQNPVVLTRTCAHIHTANSRALALSGIDAATPAPAGGEIHFEQGMLFETAHGLVLKAMPPFTVQDYKNFIRAGLSWLLQHGITTCTDPAVDPILLEAYRELEREGGLPIRVNILFIRRPDGGSQTYALPEKFVSSFLRVDSVKFFADGGLSGATAALSQPYRNTDFPSRGVLRFEIEELFELALEAHTNGFRIGTHAIGDRALDQILGVYERLDSASGSHFSTRHRIEHFGLANAAHRQKARELGVIVVPQPIFLHELAGNFERYLPEVFKPDCYNLQAMLGAGLTTAFSSDAPVVREVNPLVGIHAATCEPFVQGNQVTLEESIHAFTYAGAVASGDEHNRGTLEVGKWADFNVYSNTNASVLEWQLQGTWVRGNNEAQ
ncbi:MAG: amidohydrolase [Deinococcales bacterium]